MTKFTSLYEDFKNALDRFDEILKEVKTDIVRDSAIKRFEILFDLGWKTIKAFAEEYHNAACVSPRECFRAAFKLSLIEYDEYWLAVTKLRNDAVHSYDAELANKIYAELPEVLNAFRKLKESLEQHKSD